jgi:hypothetical protein
MFGFTSKAKKARNKATAARNAYVLANPVSQEEYSTGLRMDFEELKPAGYYKQVNRRSFLRGC